MISNIKGTEVFSHHANSSSQLNYIKSGRYVCGLNIRLWSEHPIHAMLKNVLGKTKNILSLY